MEVEAKYAVSAGDLDVVAALSQLGPYALHAEPEPQQQQNRYFDTADRRLGQARYGLRLRKIGARTLVTLKGPAEVIAGLHRRAEYEFSHADPDPHTWPAGPARELALALIGSAALVPTITISTSRSVIIARYQDQPVAEISLDRGVMHAGERAAPFSELEIELLPAGAESDLAELAGALRAFIELRPEPRSKLQRALALLEE
ncbi:CYTH domain-containing protein [Oscillochloris sp. ZM17-4]|uniref:CYTH domain-containing protein n=1 Tax=Oscillochloris sp. ZM17-4 TaxID=2866714 RepID=UPI001C733CD6|nr:CYTH domain-containing protein [Oscillochloris sp. ZM17-4]MBX0329634.1 CYTH domain-containing protein [Oscillochloris sp. ZM17-4]